LLNICEEKIDVKEDILDGIILDGISLDIA
jgi:hypothetical protein